MLKLLNKLRFVLLGRIFKTDKTVDEVINKIMTLDIKQCIFSGCWISLITDTYTYKLWDSNKYYGWLSQGSILDNSGKEIYSWNNKMANKSTMCKFKMFMKPYVTANTNKYNEELISKLK